MIETEIRVSGRPRLLAVFSFRYDAHLVAGLKDNLAPVVDGFVSWDDRAAGEVFSSEPARRRALLEAARRAGADWILAIDPDERLQDGAGPELRRLMAGGRRVFGTFRLRELYQPRAWRSDGIWGAKKQGRFFPLLDRDLPDYAVLHQSWVPPDWGLRRHDLDLDLYHLKMILPERRRARRALYAGLDPDRSMSPVGYDYLDDETGLELTPVAAGRGFSPPFTEDGGLWMPALEGKAPDPPEAVFARAAADRAVGKVPDFGGLPAALAGRAPGEQGAWLLLAGMPAEAEAAFRRAGLADGRIEALELSGDRAGAKAARAAALRDADPLFSLRHGAGSLVAEFDPGLFPFPLPGPVRVRRGAGVPPPDEMAVVVLAHRAQPGVRSAVESLAGQGARVIVVNSGGGDLAAQLGALQDRVILAEIAAPVFVGTARNVGAALAGEALVAFLAGDCTADPGWVAGRLSRHRAGAMAVSSAVLPEVGSGPFQTEATLRRVAWRLPWTEPERVIHFGLSFRRNLIRAAGWFDGSLRAGEDAQMLASISQWTAPVFAADVVTRHREPDSALAVLRDTWTRRRVEPRAMRRDWVAVVQSAMRRARAHRLQIARNRTEEPGPVGPARRIAARLIAATELLADTLHLHPPRSRKPVARPPAFGAE
jgi:hypothetical protein